MEDIEKLKAKIEWSHPEHKNGVFEDFETEIAAYGDSLLQLTGKICLESEKPLKKNQLMSINTHAKTLNTFWITVDSAYKWITEEEAKVRVNNTTRKPNSSGEWIDAVSKRAEQFETAVERHTQSQSALIAFLDLVEMREIHQRMCQRESSFKDVDALIASSSSVKAESDKAIASFKDAEGSVQAKLGEVETLKREVEERGSAVKKQQEKIDEILARLETTLSATTEFKSLADKNFNVGAFWFIVLTFIILFTAILAKFFFFDGWSLKDLGSNWSAVAAVLQRATVLSLLLIVVKLCLTKFNACLHMRATYLHRLASLNHYESFERLIDDGQKEAKAQLRLELAKMIFADPQTGMIKQSESQELNINSVVGALGRVVPTVKP